MPALVLGRLLMLGLCAQLTIGCDSDSPVRVNRSAAKLSDEPSPNASILPEPLGDKKGRTHFNASGDATVSSQVAVSVPRAKPSAIDQRVAMPNDTLQVGSFGAGYRAHARFVWSGTQANVFFSGEKIATWPQLEIELLSELPEQPARLRMVLDSPVFPLAEGTELRLRADRKGALLVWPDRRSYRPVPPGTLSSLLADRRVDRLPFLDAQLKVLDEASRAGTAIVKHRIETPLGVIEMDLVTLPDLLYAGQLLCATLLDMVRVLGREELCPEAKLPIRLSAQWEGGGGFLFEVLGYSQEPKLSLDALLMPPALPIFKPGELPPAEEFFLPAPLRRELFAVKGPEEEILARPVPPAALLVQPLDQERATKPVPIELAGDEVELANSSDRSLIVQLDRLPYVWLASGEVRHIRVRGAPIFYSARDFWGQLVMEPGLHAAPAHVLFGPTITSASDAVAQ